MDINTLWNGLMAGSTAGLLIVGLVAVIWAARTFHQTRRIHDEKKAPFVALWLSTPTSNPSGLPDDEAQLGSMAKWYAELEGRGTLADVEQNHVVVVCTAYNMGSGVAVRVQVDYRVSVFNVMVDGTDSKTNEFEGTFEITHVLPNNWSQSQWWIDTSFYPKCVIELRNPRITGLNNERFDGVISETSQMMVVVNNKGVWDATRRLRESASAVPQHLTAN